MWGSLNLGKKDRLILLSASFVMLLLAFVQCFLTTHDLSWPGGAEFDRDMAFVRNTLEGQFGQDPTYAGQYLWYNPLVFTIEAMLVKISGLPINIVVVRAGAYLNLLGPLAFFFMAWKVSDLRVAMLALLSYLFFAAGDLEGRVAATYSPWLFPTIFVQFLFYINIFLCYKAFSSQKYSWFCLLGVSTGLCFLGQAAPAILIILILISIQTGNFLRALRYKEFASFKQLLLQGLAVFIPFIVVAFPLLFFIFGKYHLHVINRYIIEWRPAYMYWQNWRSFVRSNLSVSFVIAIVGFVWFCRKFRPRMPRLIILNWLVISAVLCYQYFLYLKALQSIFFGFGLLFLFDLVFRRIVLRWVVTPASSLYTGVLALSVLVSAFVYFPSYSNRTDFSTLRRLSIKKGRDKNGIEAYQYLVTNISYDKVILCPVEHSTFPVMASARKMVCDTIMLRFLVTGQPAAARQLFADYQVSYVLLPNADLKQDTVPSPLLGQVLLKNEGYTLFAIRR